MINPRPQFNKTEKVFVKGKLSWCYLHKPDDWNNWTVTIAPDKDSLETIRDLQAQGLKNVLKKNEDNEYIVRFKRSTSRQVKGKLIGMTPPEVIGTDGEPLLKNIGNGSDGIVKLEVYEHGTPGGGKAKAARLEAVKITNLVPYEPDRDMNDEAKDKLEGMDKQEMFF